jgi:uncharacterized repeat protein (TIGR01451 family)
MSVALRRFSRSASAARASVAILASLVLITALAPSTFAVAGLVVTTPFPAVRVEPGGTASFTLTINTDVDRRVDLSVAGAPEGWKATFRGGGSIIDSVFVDADKSPDVTLEVDVPDGQASGKTRLTVRASSGTLNEVLPVDVTINEQAAGDVTLTTDFAELKGSSDQTFDFNLTLKNDTPGEIVFGFTTEGPDGWTVKAEPTSEAQATTVTVAAGASSTIKVTATPATDAAAQSYPIKVTASGGGKTATADLNVGITGSFTMDVTTVNEVLSTTANAGTAKDIEFTVKNTGTAPLTNVTLSGSPPTGWKFEQKGDPIASIAAGENANITGTLTPANDAIAGDYQLSVTAKATEKSDSVDMRVTVETPQFWGILGILLIVAVGAGLYWVFRTYGRR